jgi:hypothetical protein
VLGHRVIIGALGRFGQLGSEDANLTAQPKQFAELPLGQGRNRVGAHVLDRLRSDLRIGLVLRGLRLLELFPKHDGLGGKTINPRLLVKKNRGQCDKPDCRHRYLQTFHNHEPVSMEVSRGAAQQVIYAGLDIHPFWGDIQTAGVD